ncbi:hypothetical protein N431DRAFT_226057 [Stipitochalara longipes BDJ]|nr:hypothetical protein N431DRAFT_226057 [Stipitochalara longipes BDJ]
MSDTKIPLSNNLRHSYIIILTNNLPAKMDPFFDDEISLHELSRSSSSASTASDTSSQTKSLALSRQSQCNANPDANLNSSFATYIEKLKHLAMSIKSRVCRHSKNASHPVVARKQRLTRHENMKEVEDAETRVLSNGKTGRRHEFSLKVIASRKHSLQRKEERRIEAVARKRHR